MLDLEPIEARYKAAIKGPWVETRQYTTYALYALKDIPNLIAEVNRLRENLAEVSIAANRNKYYYSVIIGILKVQALKE